MKNKMPELKQCKCGSEDLHIQTLEYRTWFYVYCHSCGKKSPAINDRSEAVKLWNKLVSK